jgi:hypothetical protein
VAGLGTENSITMQFVLELMSSSEDITLGRHYPFISPFATSPFAAGAFGALMAPVYFPRGPPKAGPMIAGNPLPWYRIGNLGRSFWYRNLFSLSGVGHASFSTLGGAPCARHSRPLLTKRWSALMPGVTQKRLSGSHLDLMADSLA